MDLLNKALELCAEIEQRQAELRAILASLTATSETPDQSDQSDQSDLSDMSDKSDKSDESDPSDRSDSSDQPEATASTEIAATIIPEPHAATDLRKAFTINDRFRFRRELFGGDDKAFVAAIDRMNQCSDYSEIEAFISTLGWPADNEDAMAFKEIVSTFYKGYHL